MRVLVVAAHPVPESFGQALHAHVVAALRAAGHAVDDLDLYAEGFQPLLSPDERRRYHDVGANLDGVADHVGRLRAAEALVLVYPTWWYGPPAMLKGWFERVWLPGVAFKLVPTGIAGLLTDIRAFAVVTTTGSPWWFLKLVGDPGRKLIVRGLKRLCAPGCRFLWLAHHRMDASTPASRAAFLSRVGERVPALLS